MLVSITSTTPDATDLGFLLHKHPDRVRSIDVGFGRAHVFYPEATPERCTATLLVEVDPIALSRRRKGAPAQSLEPYVNDRPYAASSMPILSGVVEELSEVGWSRRSTWRSRPDCGHRAWSSRWQGGT